MSLAKFRFLLSGLLVMIYACPLFLRPLRLNDDIAFGVPFCLD